MIKDFNSYIYEGLFNTDIKTKIINLIKKGKDEKVIELISNNKIKFDIIANNFIDITVEFNRFELFKKLLDIIKDGNYNFFHSLDTIENFCKSTIYYNKLIFLKYLYKLYNTDILHPHIIKTAVRYKKWDMLEYLLIIMVQENKTEDLEWFKNSFFNQKSDHLKYIPEEEKHRFYYYISTIDS